MAVGGWARKCCPECLADPNGADCCLPRARIENLEPQGIAPWSAQCHCAVLLLNDDPEKMVGPTGNTPVVSCPPDRRITFSSGPDTDVSL